MPDPFFCLCSGCYGITADEGDLDDWLCARCEANAITVVSGQGEPSAQLAHVCSQRHGVPKDKLREEHLQ